MGITARTTFEVIHSHHYPEVVVNKRLSFRFRTRKSAVKVLQHLYTNCTPNTQMPKLKDANSSVKKYPTFRPKMFLICSFCN